MAMARRSVGALLLAAAVQAQMPPMGGAPSPNSLLNDLRAIQFPQGGGGGQAPPTGFGLGGGQPAQPMPGGFGGMPPPGGGFGQPLGGGFGQPQGGGFGQPQGGFGGMPPQGGGLPPQGFGGGGGGFGQPPQPMGGMPMGGMPQQQQQQQAQQQVEAPEDMSCAAGPHAAAWAAAREQMRQVTAAPLGMAPREVLLQAQDAVMQGLKAHRALSPEAADECGLGKLCLQLLSLLTMDDQNALAQLFSGVEQLASPVLTLLLDVPWAAAAQAGWPIFGLLAQLNLRKNNAPEAMDTMAIDGLNEPHTVQFYQDLHNALGKDGAALEAAAQAFLQKENAAGSALGPLTAMAAQAAGTPNVQQRAQMLGALQAGMKQVIGNGPELDLALGTKWPLWGLLHVGVDSLAGQ